MGKPASGGGSGGGTVKGSNANDVFHVASTAALRSTIYDGGGGSDTLDLSALTTGVTIQLPSAYPSSKSILYPDREFSGFFTDFSLATSAGKITGTIKNVENLIGGSGNDHLTVQQGGFADGGAGNDLVAGRTVIGGMGSDYLNSLSDGATDILVGGTYAGGVATPDGQHDTFEVDGSGVILDFEIGTDSLVLPEPAGGLAALQAASWTDVTYNGQASAQLQLNGNTITLAGITAAVASTIKIGLFMGGGANAITSGPGDDIIWPGSGASQLTFGSGSGNDVVTHFNIADDTLIFPDGAPATWTQVSVNGETALQGVYDNGASSVTILGLGEADASHLIVESGQAASADLFQFA
jgi:hypothetical protein